MSRGMALVQLIAYLSLNVYKRFTKHITC